MTDQVNTTAHKKRKGRVKVVFPIYLELENGDIVSGETKNISTSGIFVTTSLKNLSNYKDGSLGVGRLKSRDVEINFNCEMVRKTKEGFAIRWGVIRNQLMV
ncbi:MAG: PilZ domain-containing protein [Magnetococcales bacterium]|nr:PilZ domain-containing protein [Magnetococcales bacterium]